MKSYMPAGLLPVAAALALAAFDLSAGFALQLWRGRNWRRAAAWMLLSVNIAIAASATVGQPPGVRMLVMIAAVLLAMKCIVVAVESTPTPLPPAAWIAFAVGWPGMRPEIFRQRGGGRLAGAAGLIRVGVKRVLLGALSLLVARIVWRDLGSTLIATPLLLVGLSLMLHFGVFNIVAGAWRLVGVDCQPLFRAPLSSRSLGEFWARRWNLAFSEMTAAAVYRPLCRHVDRGLATLAAFLFSGALHELAISFPVSAGYGGPMLYFALHGGLVVLERGLARAGLAIDRHAWLGRLWTIVWLTLPLPLLFHFAFLDGVVWPLIGMENRR